VNQKNRYSSLANIKVKTGLEMGQESREEV